MDAHLSVLDFSAFLADIGVAVAQPALLSVLF